MRKLTFIATAIALVYSTLGVPTAQAQWPQTTFKDTRMSVEVGAKVYDRPGTDATDPVVFDSVTNSTLFNSGQATDLGTNWGAEIALNLINHRDREIQIRTVLVGWDEQALIEGPNLQSGFFPSQGIAPTSFEYNYEADYFSIEVMRRRAVAPGLTVMAGPRFVSTKDQITTIGTRTISFFDVSQRDVFEATNALIGLQCGLEANMPVTGSIYASGFLRLGGYYNPTEFSTFSENNVTPVTLTSRRTESTESFLAEVGGRVYVDLLPNCLSSYVGYEASWIDGIALAPANAGSTVPGIDTNNTLFFQAITFGTELVY